MIYVSDLWNQEEGEPIKFIYLRTAQLSISRNLSSVVCLYEGCKVQLFLLDEASVCTFNNFKLLPISVS